MPKFTKILAAITLVLGLLAWLSVSKSNRKATFDSEDALFAISDSGTVTKIILSDNNKNQVTLTSSLNDWKINNTWTDDKSLSVGLINLIYKAQVKRPVFKEMEEKAMMQLKKQGITVQLFKGDVLIKKYTLATDSSDQLSLFALMDGYAIPYSIELPGNDQPLASLLDAKALTWRSKIVFSSTIGSVENLSVTYRDTPTDNFEIQQKERKYLIKDMPGADSIKILSYIDLYKNVEIRQYIDKQSIKDSLLKLTPSFTIQVKDKIAARSNRISIYYIDKQKTPIYGIIGQDNNMEAVVIRPRLFEYLLQKRSFFQYKKK